MNSKILIGGLLGAIALFILGALLYGMLFMNTLNNLNGTIVGVMRPQEDMSGMFALFLGNLVTGILLSYIFGNWAGINTPLGGAKAGALILFMIALGYNLVMLGTTYLVKPAGIALDSIIYALLGAGAGGVIGWWLGRGK